MEKHKILKKKKKDLDLLNTYHQSETSGKFYLDSLKTHHHLTIIHT